MARFRFFSDTSERAVLDRFPDLSFDADNCVELETPEQFDYAQALGAFEEPVTYSRASTSGVDAWLDTGAFSARSNAARMPGYTPPPILTVFGVKRRSTRGQPL